MLNTPEIVAMLVWAVVTIGLGLAYLRELDKRAQARDQDVWPTNPRSELIEQLLGGDEIDQGFAQVLALSTRRPRETPAQLANWHEDYRRDIVEMHDSV